MLTRPIPSSGEALPVIGCGTWQGFDVEPDAYSRLEEVLRALSTAGGTMIDSSPMYGNAETVVGALLSRMAPPPRTFLATKVWTVGREAGLAQMRRSLAFLKTDRLDLMQVHNLLDWRTHLKTLHAWKQEERVRYVGVTHYTASGYDELERVMRAEPLDFVQVNYSLDDRRAEERLLPLAADRGIAVIVNLPFGGGGLLRRLRTTALPPFAADLGCSTWAPLLLKFVLGHPAVTCTIPGTGQPEHMRDNAQAGHGTLPDAAMRKALVAVAGAN